MPYIPVGRRVELDRKRTSKSLPVNAGELNFVITKTVLEYVALHGKSYTVYNEVVGVLECVKQEFYRRAVAPYEDIKAEDNGDVY